MKPLVSMEVVEKEEANFETEISEEDVPGEWKLKGQVLTRSPVRLIFGKLTVVLYKCRTTHIMMYLDK